MIFALTLTCLGLPVACGMRWFNVKVIAADRKKERAQLDGRPEVYVRRESEVSALAGVFKPPGARGDTALL